MTKSEVKFLLQKYHLLLDEAEKCYNNGSPATETSEVEGKIELIKQLMTQFGIKFKE